MHFLSDYSLDSSMFFSKPKVEWESKFKIEIIEDVQELEVESASMRQFNKIDFESEILLDANN